MNPNRTHDDEQCLLAAVIAAPETIQEVAATLTSHDFHSEPHRKLWALLEAMHEAGEDIRDRRRLISNVRDSGVMNQIGGAAGFGAHYIDAGVAGNVGFYAKEVKAHSLRRDFLAMVDTARSEGARADDPVPIIQELRAMLDRMLTRASGGGVTETLKQAAGRQIDLMKNPGQESTGKLIKTGIDCIDDKYGGFGTGKLIVPAARPGNGKSALMKQIAGEMERHGRKTLIVTLEMSPSEIATRILSERTGIDGTLFEVDDEGANELSPDQWKRIEDAYEAMHEDVMHIHAPTGRQATIEQIAGYTRLMHARHGIEVMMLDYIGIVEKSHSRQTDYEKVTAAARTLKSLARELGIVVVCLSQLNRGPEKSEGIRRPRLSDLRDSGAVEQDSDVVMFLHRMEEGQDDFALIIAKWRNAKTITCPMRLIGEHTKFVTREVAEDGDTEVQHVPAMHGEFAAWGG
ncbi:MAG: DnaB-like helicase C-terminal domain-containing protein [Candidatus Paceibacterota bacterium]